MIILTSCLAVYFNALFNGLVYDDIFQVSGNPWIRDIRHIPEIFSTSVLAFRGSGTNFYRPMMHVFYMLDYYIFGLSAWGFHLTNILFHAGVSILVFLTTSALLEQSNSNPHPPIPSPSRGGIKEGLLSPPFIAALLFATHPIHTEAVTWIAGIPELSFTFFYLLSFYLYVRSEDGLGGSYLLSIASFFLSLLCKEPAMTLPLVLIVFDYFFRRSTHKLSDTLKRYIPYLVVAGLYLVIRFNALGAFAPVKSVELSPYQYAINGLVLFIQYLGKSLLPVNLNIWHVFHPITSLFTKRGIISFIAAISFLGAGYLTARKSGIAFLGLLFIAVPLLPALYIPGLPHGIENAFTERYLYLPSFGFVLLLALLINWTRLNEKRLTGTVALVLVMIIGFYSADTLTRNTVWKDDYRLWSDSVRKSPDGYMPHNNLGRIYGNNGQVDEAIKHFQEAIRLKPDYPVPHYNLGVAYRDKGLLDRAIEQFQIALSLNPNFETYKSLGNAYRAAGSLDKAVKNLEIAVRLNPDDAEVHHTLGIAYAEMGQKDKAIEHLITAAQLDPQDTFIKGDLAHAYGMKTHRER